MKRLILGSILLFRICTQAQDIRVEALDSKFQAYASYIHADIPETKFAYG